MFQFRKYFLPVSQPFLQQWSTTGSVEKVLSKVMLFKIITITYLGCTADSSSPMAMAMVIIVKNIVKNPRSVHLSKLFAPTPD